MSAGGTATIVLAAGAGSRFGGVKQLAEIEGESLLGRVLAVLDGNAEPRIVVLGAAAEEVRSAVPSARWKVVRAADWAEGPGASLRAGLAAVPTAEAAMIVLADLAWLRREAVERVRAAAASSRTVEAFRAVEGERPGHPLLIRGDLLVAARAAPDPGLRPLLARVAVEPVECSGLGVCRDVDTVADLDT